MAGGGNKGQGRGAALNINLTPMIDCTMLLVIFFLLSTELASPDFVKMELPNPNPSTAGPYNPDNRVRINVIPTKTEPIKTEAYQIGPDRFDDTIQGQRAMAAKVALHRKASKDAKNFVIEIRCDARIPSSQVQPIFGMMMDDAIMNNKSFGVPKVQFTALAPTKG